MRGVPLGIVHYLQWPGRFDRRADRVDVAVYGEPQRARWFILIGERQGFREPNAPKHCGKRSEQASACGKPHNQQREDPTPAREPGLGEKQGSNKYSAKGGAEQRACEDPDRDRSRDAGKKSGVRARPVGRLLQEQRGVADERKVVAVYSARLEPRDRVTHIDESPVVGQQRRLPTMCASVRGREYS